jgi:hypothetical protein
MNMTELRKKAKPFNLVTNKMNKTQLIHSIQQAEGNPACFGTSTGQCPYTDCCFKNDCLSLKSPVVKEI